MQTLSFTVVEKKHSKNCGIFSGRFPSSRSLQLWRENFKLSDHEIDLLFF
jgi:hypothetical protein